MRGNPDYKSVSQSVSQSVKN